MKGLCCVFPEHLGFGSGTFRSSTPRFSPNVLIPRPAKIILVFHPHVRLKILGQLCRETAQDYGKFQKAHDKPTMCRKCYVY